MIVSERFDVDCQNDECAVLFEFCAESGETGDGVGHVAKCPNCGSKTYFEVMSVLIADSCSFQIDED